MPPAANRLERAIALHAQWRAGGGSTPASVLLANNPDLAEILEALMADQGEVERSIAEASRQPRELGGYRLLAEIAHGGMGVVYRARQVSLDRDVAVKVLASNLCRQPTAMARFRREATLAARLVHPNIVAIHAVGRDDDTQYCVMEFVEGGALTRIDPATGAIRSVRATVELAAKVADALAYAHACGVLHRDVKPGNILVRADGEPVLTDFGLARQIDDPGLTQSGQFAGTPWYASPEQLADSSLVDARADVWSLGATLYELLTGERPFPGESTQGVIDRIRSADPMDPLRLAPELSPDLAAIVLKALEKSPERRYPTAAALRDELRAFLEFRPILARRAGRLTRTARWLQRHPGWRAASALLVLAIVVVPVIVSFAVAGERDRAVAAQELARRKAYRANLVAANAALAAGDGSQAEQLLAACPDDLRGPEWGYTAGGLDQSLWTGRMNARRITAVALSADTALLAAADEGGALALFEAATGTVRWRRAPENHDAGPIVAVGFAAGGDALLTATSHGALRRHLIATGDVGAAVPGLSTEVAVCMRTDSGGVLRTVATGRFELFDDELRAIATPTLPYGEGRPRTAIVGDGTQVAGTPQLGGFAVWDLATGARAQVQSYEGAGTHLAADDRLRRIVGFDARTGFARWDRDTGTVRHLHHGARHLLSMDVSPDGRWLVAGGLRGDLLVHHLDRSRLVRILQGHAAAIHAVAVGTAGWVVTGAADGTVKLWNHFLDAGPGELAGVGYSASLSGAGFGRSLAVDAAGTLYTGGLDGTVRCSDPRSGELRWQRQLPHWVNAIASLDGSSRLLVSWHDVLQRLDTVDGGATGEAVRIPGMAYVRRLAVEPGESRCAMLDDAGALAILDLRTDRHLGPQRVCALGRTSLTGGLVWSRAFGLLAAGEDGAVRRIDPETLATLAEFAVAGEVTAMVEDRGDLLVATWDPSRRRGQLARHELPSGRRRAAQEVSSHATGLALLQERLVVSRWDGRLGLHDRVDLAAIVELPQPAPALWNVVAHEPGGWLAIQCYDGEPRLLASRRQDLPLVAQRRRALQAAAAQLAAETLAATGWTPRARAEIETRSDLPADLRAAAVAALPPTAAWRLIDIAFYLGHSIERDQTMSRRLAEIHACLLEAAPAVTGEQADACRVAQALVELRLGRHGAALETLRPLQPDRAGPPWWACICHFVRCRAYAALGDATAAKLEFAAMQATLDVGPEQHRDDLLREAEACVARPR